MKTWVRKTLSVGVLAAGALLFTSANAAHADDKVSQDTSWNYGIGNGIQAAAPIDLGANVCGNAISALGWASGQAACGNVFEGGSYKQKSTKNYGALNGAQVLIPVDGGVNVVGNAVAAAGGAQAAGTGVNSFGGHSKGKSKESATTEKKGGGDPTQLSHSNYGLLNGAQIYAPINLGANVCGNSASVLGFANGQAACWNLFGGQGKGKQESGIEQVTYDNFGALNGLQLAAPINGFANVTGNAVSVAGASHAAGASKNVESGGNDDIKQDSHNNVGIANGAQIAAPVDLGLNLCGNALGVLGAANAAADCGNDFGGNGGNGGHQGGGNGGDNGNDDDYDADHDGDDDGPHHHGGNNGGNNGDDDDYAGNNGDKYGDAPRKAGKAHAKSAATEGSAVDSVTGGLGGNNANVAGLTNGLLGGLG
ncbi:chaplin family protein [Actinoplanes sp. NPDC051470]|uniref:chaplin family protein n=1 Tax=Actinoplanes sp. NPDC051470 TaxID=3157224 RepID=UPI00343B53E8